VVTLRDDRLGVRQAAARALGAIGGAESERALTEALGHKDAATRVAAADALGQVPVGRHVDALAGALADRDKGVRESAVAALGRLGSPAAIEALIAAFEGSDRELRQAAAAALQAAAWVPADSRQRAIRAVLRNDVAAAEAEGAAAVAPLLVSLGAADPAVRRGAAEALGAIGDARAVGPLVSALGDQDELVRGAAVGALARIGPAAAVAVIAALGGKGAHVRAAASDVIAAVGESRVVQALLGALTVEDILGARRAVDGLQQLLEHAAARVPAADLERIAAQPDLLDTRSGRRGALMSGPVDGDEIRCEDLRRLAAQELARRTQP
jgi:HEAT repeat protein